MSDPVLATSEVAARLGVALFCGIAIGLNRDLHHKRAGVRTFGLVSLATAALTVAAVLTTDTAGVTRVVQGIVTGIGFLGAGMILHPSGSVDAHGLTTAAAVWFAAVLAVIAGLGALVVALAVLAAGLLLLMLGKPFERAMERVFGTPAGPVDPDD
jgi:putative Mg2+ transporter-C (MgtC) family protein